MKSLQYETRNLSDYVHVWSMWKAPDDILETTAKSFIFWCKNCFFFFNILWLLELRISMAAIKEFLSGTCSVRAEQNRPGSILAHTNPLPTRHIDFTPRDNVAAMYSWESSRTWEKPVLLHQGFILMTGWNYVGGRVDLLGGCHQWNKETKKI